MAVSLNWGNIDLRLRRYFPVIFLLLLAAFLRLYRISDYMTFLGDEGRDALVWLRMVYKGKFTLIGPSTSIGNMYLGPLYYYLMLPFFVIFGLSPVGPSVGVAFFSLATIFLIWWMGKEWFGNLTGLIAALFYAISPVAIFYGRSSWNPNIMPFFALLTIFGIWNFWKKNNFFWLPLIGVFLSFAIQSHYLGLLLIPTFLIFWFLTFLGIGKAKMRKKFLFFSFLCLFFFLFLTVFPLVWFDFRHNFINYQAFYKFFSERQETVNFKIYKALPKIWPIWQMMITRLVAAKEGFWGMFFSVFLFLGLVFSFFLARRERKLKPLILILIWLSFGLIGLGNYKQHIYDHYFGFLFPVPFFILGMLLEIIFKKGNFGKLLVFFILVFLFFLNFKNSPLREIPNFQMRRSEEVDRKILAESEGEPFNLALIAKQNYKDGYAFFLEKWKAKMVEIEPAKAQETITDQLFVVCEDTDCQPVGHPKAEIANFGWARIEEEWQFPWGVKLFKLTHLK